MLDEVPVAGVVGAASGPSSRGKLWPRPSARCGHAAPVPRSKGPKIHTTYKISH